jgi:very-short-patch-repair endonuclease
MLGTHFRRQVPIGPYVADFACMAARLIVEVDGSQHGSEAGTQKDAQRTQWLEQEGYRVLRFWNNEVMRNIKGVLEAIHVALYGSLDSDVIALKHERARIVHGHPTPARYARRPSPSRGG